MIGVTNNEHKADVRAYLGKTGNGKTRALLDDLHTLKPKRLIVWDYKHEYTATSFDRLGALCDHIRKNKLFEVAFRVDQVREEVRKNDFEIICNVAYALGDVCLVVEELQFVTEASRAPDAWKRVCTTGRKRGMVIMGTSQRPASMDKHFLGNCSHITCCGLGFDDDAVTVAKSLPGVTPQDLMDLRPGTAYHYGPGMEKAQIKTIFTP